MSRNFQDSLNRVRTPRVQITYDVQIGDAMEKKELPFVVGVMADLSGQPKEGVLKALRERKFVEIDRDNFNSVLEKCAPRLALKVQNRLTDDGSKMAVELNFRNMDDFSPAKVAEQVEPLRELLDMRRRLSQLLTRMEGNDKLEKELEAILTNTEKAQTVAKQLGLPGDGAQAPKAE